jgi:hypothetical protein
LEGPKIGKSKLNFRVIFFFLLAVLAFISGCQQAFQDDEETPTFSIANVTVTKDLPSHTPVPSPTSPATPTKIAPTSTPSPTWTPAPAVTSTPTVRPTNTPTVTPTPNLLSVREPTYEQLELYLQNTTIRNYRSGEYSEFRGYQNFVWDESVRAFPNPDTLIRYEDVNGDGESDLLLAYANTFYWGTEFLIILLWEGDKYSQPMGIIEISKLPTEVHHTLEDWTGDGIVEIVWDMENGTSGSGSGITQREKYIIQCLSECNVIWDYTTSVDVYGVNQYYLRRIEVADITLDADPLRITAVTEAYHLPYIDGESTSPLNVLTTTQQIFLWTGSTFELSETSILTPSYQITSTFQISQDSEEGFIELNAVNIPADPGTIEFASYDCSIEVASVPLGPIIKCTPLFTEIWWQDVTADGEKELIANTLFENKGYLYIWRRAGDQYTPIANVVGDIIRPNLYGVKLGNVDADPAIEILAGEWRRITDDFCFLGDFDVSFCWQDITRGDILYDWNGVEFRLK